MKRPTAVLLAATAVATPFALTAQTLNLPPRKPGLWEVSTTIERQKDTADNTKASPPISAQMCLDASTDRELMDYALKFTEGKCKSLTSKREGKSIVIDADCTFSGRATKSKIVFTGDFQSAYTMRTEGTIERGSKGPQAMLTTQTATWKSADCPGMKPGDITLFGGVKMNINQLKALSGLIR
ncbi:MAG: DUF3617 family protein [Hyphomicrobiaceae bacterium]|nr:DUF3617 family protein [Hyphomicrobiaceae bacterium]